MPQTTTKTKPGDRTLDPADLVPVNDPSNLIEGCIGLIEASQFEAEKIVEALCQDYQIEAKLVSPAKLFQVGCFYDLPLWVSVTKISINNQFFAVYWPSSDLVIHSEIAKWIKKFAPQTACINDELNCVSAPYWQSAILKDIL